MDISDQPASLPHGERGRREIALERIRWRTRRGLLELDIVLGRFVERHYAALDEAGRAAFDVLLEMPDTELWDMITGKTAPQAECRAVLELLRAV